MLRRLRTGFALLVAIAALSALPAGSVPLEDAVKGTFLYKFAPFVTWPESAFAGPNAPLTICIFANQGLADSLQSAVAGQRDGAHPIVVRAVREATPDCQILYVPGPNGRLAALAVAGMKGRPVLTVTDGPADAPGHGVIGFVTDHGHVRFDIDNAAAAASGLIISSKLLALARVVKTNGAAP